jgi:4-aminobutyrate aminotransferase-like enzyme
MKLKQRLKSRSLTLWQEHGEYILPVMPFRDSVIDRCCGSYMYDVDGNEILDLSAVQFCSIIGHNHPDFMEAIWNEMQRSLHTGSQFVAKSILEGAKALANILPGYLKNVIFLSTGSEANEFALRVAKCATKRTGVIGFDRGYYGISLATRNIGLVEMASDRHDSKSTMGENYKLISPNCSRCLLGLEYELCGHRCLQISQRLLEGYEDNIAAVFVEAVISAGGMIFPPKSYMQKLGEWAKKIGAMLVMDEAQTGFGRRLKDVREWIPGLSCCRFRSPEKEASKSRF